MTPRLSGHFSFFGLVFFVLKTMPGVVKNLQFCPQSLGVMIEFLCNVGYYMDEPWKAERLCQLRFNFFWLQSFSHERQ